MDKQEQMQRRATKIVSHLEHKFYKEGLKEVGIYSVEKRCLRGDGLAVFV